MILYDRYSVYDWLVAYKTDHDGNSPSLREIMQGCKLQSTSVASRILRDLASDGCILIDEKRSRCIHIVGAKWLPPPGGHPDRKGKAS